MTDEERERYDQQTEHVHRDWARENQFWGTENFRQEDSGSEEVCTDKGKGANPRNWGGLDLPEEELDPGFQQQMFGLRESELTQGAIGNSNTQNPVKAEPELDFDAPDGEAPSREDIKQYLRDKRRLVKELDKLKLKQSNNKRRGRAGSVPVSDELALLIEKVTRGRSKLDRGRYSKGTPPSKKDTRPIAQITGRSALGQAFKRLEKKLNGDMSEPLSSSEPDSESESDSESPPSSSSGSSGDEEALTDGSPQLRILLPGSACVLRFDTGVDSE
ncbi:hypothetical protein C0989_007623 [Termitomyces sp. Mn162]|nr:hypothetical protein C0989_007623 [Termitomyces sp. Mn162]